MPLALVLVGSLLAAIPAKRVLGGVRVWVLAALRLLAEPLALWLVLRPMGIDPLVMGIAATQMAMPLPSTARFCAWPAAATARPWPRSPL